MLTIEYAPSKESEPCPCCGGKTTALTRFVYKDGDAHAIYYASFCKQHAERVVFACVSLGEWGEGSTPAQRVAFALGLRADEDNFNVSLLDAEDSPWQESKIIGRTLNRDEALAHPLLKEAFHISDHMLSEDIAITDYLDA